MTVLPPDSLGWLIGSWRATVLELDPGTGSLTEALLSAGHEVYAIEPDPRLRAQLQQTVPGAYLVRAAPDRLPFPPAGLDVVVSTGDLGWLTDPATITELSRVLRPDGTLALVWSGFDAVVPWVRRFVAAARLSNAGPPTDPAGALEASRMFDRVEVKRRRHWHELDRAGLQAMVAALPEVAAAPDADRRTVLADVDEVYLATARPPEPVRLPYVTHTLRARVSSLANFQRESG